ncbi:hypothetical protein KIL84_002448 [Mauremys mutica]|uniref:Uncharacterized protein n=1 Tax=Mauremys mutica TaxID=74926 RepID=A0A9D3X5N5_9SAUR|nr:hypothetical protein KIL84_002448 [Mauremys mutica]
MSALIADPRNPPIANSTLPRSSSRAPSPSRAGFTRPAWHRQRKPGFLPRTLQRPAWLMGVSSLALQGFAGRAHPGERVRGSLHAVTGVAMRVGAGTDLQPQLPGDDRQKSTGVSVVPRSPVTAAVSDRERLLAFLDRSLAWQ